MKSNVYPSLPTPWHAVTWLVILSQVLTPFANQLFAVDQRTPLPPVVTATANPNDPVPVRTPRNVKVNRTTPDVQRPSLTVGFSSAPTDEEVFHATVFSEPLVPM